MKKGHPPGAPAAGPLLLANPPRRRWGGETSVKERRGGEGDSHGSAGPGCGLTALPGWAPSAAAHPPLCRAPGQSPDPRGREKGGRSSPQRVTLQRPLLAAARTPLEPPARGERLPERNPPPPRNVSAPGAPRRYSVASPRRSA
ncbi:hypothetical protein NDU88_004555 [Pleurodeles waltl]|uniref:Uncharacterized protein n=1 Tax=Pleurodeles waltl TaxID=8319 RepID=A0AAV7LLR4_PLEWA|nr:hypothetical protein NDU88_004555 [Pleurodeles waltl]